MRQRGILTDQSAPPALVATAWRWYNAGKEAAPAKKEKYGWPFVERWTERNNDNFPFRGGDLQTAKFGLVEPKWVRGLDDDDGKAFGYNRFFGTATVVLIGIVAAAAFGTWRRTSSEHCHSEKQEVE